MTTPRSQAASHRRCARQTRSPDAGFRRPGTAAGGEGNDLRTGTPMDPAVAGYIDAIPSQHRAMFDRTHQLILDTCPGAAVVLSYNMPTYQLGTQRLHLGVWQHGVCLPGLTTASTLPHREREPARRARHRQAPRNRKLDLDIIAPSYPDAFCGPS